MPSPMPEGVFISNFNLIGIFIRAFNIIFTLMQRKP